MATDGRLTTAVVRLWDRDVGAVAWDPQRGCASFQYMPEFARRGPAVAPLTMPLDAARIYSFPTLNRDTYRGLPGLLADALPDRYGNALIDLWLRRQGRDVGDFNPVERLCYMSTRGMGALEFKPSIGPRYRTAVPVEISRLVELAGSVLKEREALAVRLDRGEEEALKTVIRVGTSAGGARAKAVIAWNQETGEVRSGQVPAPAGFEPWLLKFDGASEDALGDPKGFGRVEYAYHLMAGAAGVVMSRCWLLEEGGRAHFMTRRFDRTADGEKIHVQSLCALGHYDFNAPGAYGYEHALGLIRKLNLGHPALQQMFRRMVFNVAARNQDDHTRNIAFSMDRAGTWALAPAFDVIWSYNPDGRWTDRHQMSVNGKRDGFALDDLLVVARQFDLNGAESIVEEVCDAVGRWPEFAREAGVEPAMMERIAATHRKFRSHP